MSKVVKQPENNLSLEKPSQLLQLHQQDQHVTFQKQIKDGIIGTNVNQNMFDQNLQGQQNNRISPAKPMNVSQSQVSPRLMQQAHSYKQDNADTYNNQGAIEQKSFSHTSAQGATIATTGNLIVGTNTSVKNQSGPTTASIPHQTSSVVPLSAAPHLKAQHQKGGQFRKNDNIKDQAYMHQNMAGINEFKNKVNMMLQNHMYMNVGQQQAEANKTPFSYEQDLNMEENRFQKMSKIETDFNASQGNNNIKNILLKNNRNYSNTKHNTVRKVGSKDENIEATDKNNTIQAEKEIISGDIQYVGSERLNKGGQYDPVNMGKQQQPQQSGLMIQQQSSQGQVFSPLNSQPKSSKKLQIANGSISSETNKQLHKSETKGKTPLTYIVPGGAPGSGVVINSEKQALSTVGINGNNPVNSYSSYSSNNQKQQQRRRLLFEYGMEKKMQNQGSAQQQVSTSQGPSIGSTQLSLGGQEQSSYGGYARAIQSNGIAMHVGPNRDSGGPWTRSNVGMADSANRQQNKARLYGGFSTSNGSATGASTTLSTLISRNGASDKYRRDPNIKGGKPGDDTKEAQEIQKKIEVEDYQQFQQLLDSLKHINIDKLDIRDQEQLCFLSEQYQFHMHQFKEMKVTENIILADKDQNQVVTQQSDLRYNNNLSQFSKRSDGENNQDSITKNKTDGKDKEKNQSEVYSSQDRFKENEKNLSEFRLQRNRQNMKTKDDEEQSTPASILERDQGLELNRQNSKKLMYNMENKTAQGLREDDENGPRKLTDSKKSLMTMAGTSVMNTGSLPHVSGQGQPLPMQTSDKNLMRNGSIQRSNSDNTQKMLQQQPVYVNELTSTTNTTGTNATTGAPISKNYQPSIFDQLKNPQQQNVVQPYQPVPPVVPEMNIALIKQLTHQQRINVFKVLQKREKGKFMGIQQKKLQKQTIGLHESIDKTYKSSRKGLNENFKSGDSKSQNDRFLDIVRRQGGNHHAANNLSIQKLEQIRKQWVADLKAFGIFQQNELWQFGQMNEQQQKQILICNLQQGKFENLNVSLILNEGISGQPRSSLWQQHQQRQAYGSALDKINDPQNPDNKNQHSGQQQPLTPVRNSVNFTGNRHGQNNNIQNKNYRHTENLDNVQVVEPLSGALLQGGQSSNRSRSKSDQQQNPDAERSSLNTIDKTININVKNLSETKSVVPQTQPLSKMHVYSDMTTVNMDAQRTAREGHEDQIEKLYYLAQRGDSGSNLDNKQNGLKMQNDYYNESLSQHNFVNSPTYKVKNPLGTDETFSAEMMDAKDETIKMLRKQTNPITRRYEDSKNQFEACLHAILAKHNSNNLPGQVYQRKYRNVSIDNLIPNFPKHLLNNKINEIEKYRPKFRTEKSSSFNNHSSSIHGFQNGIASNKLNKAKDNNLKKDNAATDPKLKKEEEKNLETTDAKDEALPEEPKKPRYFPPRRIPNPFESAAQEQEKFLQARKEALAKYSNISKNRFKQDESMPLKYVVRPGNNSKLIMRVLETSGRLTPKFESDGEQILFPGWEPADDHFDSLYNFKWKPTSGGIKWDLISKHGLKQLVNHVKGHGALTTKDNLFLNMKQYYESQKLNIYDIVPLTIVLDYLRDDVGERVEQFVQIMKVMEKNINEHVTVVNQRLHESQLQKEKTLKTPFKLSECCHNNQNLWMLKPTGFNRGIGIHIFQTFDQLRDIMCNHYGIGRGQRDKTSIFQTHNHNHNHRENMPTGDVAENKQHKNFTFVLQKLIERPLLYNQRKFDIRQWVLFNASDGKIYLFAEAYVRTSSKEYQEYDPNIAEEEQIFMQLTNNAVQRDGDEYGKYEEGNIVSIGTLFKFIATQAQANGKSAQDLENDFKTSMINVIIDTIKSVKGKISMQKHCFELLGYDFIFDEHLNTILIEVNTNPCLEESNALLKKLLPRMVDDLLNITMDPLFQNDSGKYTSKFPVTGDVFGEDLGHPGYKDDENLYKLIYTIPGVE